MPTFKVRADAHDDDKIQLDVLEYDGYVRLDFWDRNGDEPMNLNGCSLTPKKSRLVALALNMIADEIESPEFKLRQKRVNARFKALLDELRRRKTDEEANRGRSEPWKKRTVERRRMTVYKAKVTIEVDLDVFYTGTRKNALRLVKDWEQYLPLGPGYGVEPRGHRIKSIDLQQERKD